jgi:hypothetical protein
MARLRQAQLPLLIDRQEFSQPIGTNATPFGAVGAELDAIHQLDGANAHPKIIRNKPAALLALVVFVLRVDRQDPILAKPVAADHRSDFDIAFVADQFTRSARGIIGHIDQHGGVVGIGCDIIEVLLPEERAAAHGEAGVNLLGLTDFGHTGIIAIDHLDDQVGLSGFVVQQVIVVDFALAKPGAFAFAEEVHHGHGNGHVHGKVISYVFYSSYQCTRSPINLHQGNPEKLLILFRLENLFDTVKP